MIQNYNGYKVLKEFLENPTKGFSLREISRNLKLGLPSVISYIKQLEKEKLIIKKDIHNITLFFANGENNSFRIYKIEYNLFNLENSKLLDYLEKDLNYPVIILFGSSSIGEDIENSDYDLAIFTDTKARLDLSQFEKQVKRKIQTFVFNKEDLKKLKNNNKEMLNNILNGIKIRGMIKIF